MIRSLLPLLLLSAPAFARTIPVATPEALQHAARTAVPGDTVVLRKGNWPDLLLDITVSGTVKQPIVFRAQQAGEVRITGKSHLRLGGDHLVVSGLLFTNGYAPQGSVIEFRSGKKVANNCRLTNCAIDDFNKPRRMSEDQWIQLYGRNNRVDHCSFRDKKNMGVLMAVILDDERSRENAHSIDHNYFGRRIPLASNTGEIIRVGVSQHALFASRTKIEDNFFEHCDGETEIVSIKSGNNIVRGNLFKECQGGVVLRHGNDNTVENNIFLGNGKEGTGGVRIINGGQWVVNNLFYRCRGVDFRAPLSIMNGIPNSPAHRYVQVTDAVVMKNTFFDCSPISFGEGSDAERTLAPDQVLFAKNVFYNLYDTALYHQYDRIDGIRFSENKYRAGQKMKLAAGFEPAELPLQKQEGIALPFAGRGLTVKYVDSLRNRDVGRVSSLNNQPGFTGADRLRQIRENAYAASGASWFRARQIDVAVRTISCATEDQLYAALEKQSQPLLIRLTGLTYSFARPLIVRGKVTIQPSVNRPIVLQTTDTMMSLFLLRDKGHLVLRNLNLVVTNVRAGNFISNDTSGSSEHFNLEVRRSVFSRLGAGNFFHAYRSSVADSIIIDGNVFEGNRNSFTLDEETDDKGYYNVERMAVTGNKFLDHSGTLLSLYRGGNDESTMGPNLLFSGNQVEAKESGAVLMHLTGVQRSRILHNRFTLAGNPVVIRYKDIVRARHALLSNRFSSGTVDKNLFVTEANNTYR